MPCKNCGGTLDQTDDTGATNGGEFREEYRCLNCGATGTISGESSDPPARWNKYGSAFEGRV